MSTSNERHACHCGKSFIRREHLRRHQASHIGKAFRCDVCGRSFTRSDLLRRHATLHVTADVQPEPRRDKACDTCHANKTKCSGGEVCDLCAKRSVTCTYDRGAPASEQSSSPDTDAAATPTDNTAADRLQIDESDEGSQQSFCRTSALAILRNTLAPQCNDDTATAKTIPRSWLNACIESYLASFHTRWQILHAPILNETTDSVPLVASIVAIDSWLHGDAKLKDVVLAIHYSLVQRFCKELAESSPPGPAEKWPVELYQVALLNVAFAFDTGKKEAVVGARMLFSLLVALFRANGCFQDETLTRQRLDHYPGDFRPFVYSSRENWTRMVVSMFKIDVYLSIFDNHPPLIRRQELAIGLPSTFSLWNSYGIMLFFSRSRYEPWARRSLLVSQLDIRDFDAVPDGIVPDDIQLYLLGIQNEIWSLDSANDKLYELKKADISERLLLCQRQLEYVFDESQKPVVAGSHTAKLLKAHLANEEPVGSTWRQAVMHRIHAQILNIRQLLLLLTIHLHADVQAIRDVYLSPAPMALESIANVWQRKMLALQTWAQSGDGRSAVAAALHISSTYEACVLVSNSSGTNVVDPIGHRALSTAALVLWAWTMNDAEMCVCNAGMPKTDITSDGVHLTPGTQSWVQMGGMSAFRGSSVCQCTVATRIGHWTDALARAGRAWEDAGIDVKAFRRAWLGLEQ